MKIIKKEQNSTHIESAYSLIVSNLFKKFL